MPDFDGTGPRGLGPMSGKGRGYCMLKISQLPDEPHTGFAGLAGKPLTLYPGLPSADIAFLKFRVQYLQLMLQDIQRRIEVLEDSRRRRCDPQPTAGAVQPP